MVAKVLRLKSIFITEDAILSKLAYGGQTLEQLAKKLKLPKGKIKISSYYCNRPDGTEDTLTL